MTPPRVRALWLVATLLLGAPALRGQAIGPLDFVDDNVPVPAEVLTAIGALLPEHSNEGAAFVSPVYQPDLEVLEACTVRVLFLSEGAGYENSLGYYTYTLDPFTILDRQLILPRLTDSLLQPGDRVTLRDVAGLPRIFQPGERIGFFLTANGWNAEPEIQAWDAALATLPSEDPALNLVRAPGFGTFTTRDEANPELALGVPELARHTAMLLMPPTPGFLDGEPYVLMAWEDLLRPGADNDYNDVVFVTQADPVEAVDMSGLAVVASGDPDGDGITGTSDAYPYDPDRATILSFPTHGWNGLGLEDLYPASVDGDYNDTVLLYRFDLVARADGAIKDVRGTMHLVARGGVLEHRLGLHLPGLPEDADGTLLVERFLSDDAGTHELAPPRSIADVVALDDRRIEHLFPSSHAALPDPPEGFLVNTAEPEVERLAASARMVISFDQPVPAEALGLPPWDIYWMVYSGQTWADVHLAGVPGFADRDPSLPEESGSAAFIDDQGYPWLLEVPQGWRHPLEHQFIGAAYPQFLDWAASHGTSAADWYETAKPSKVSLPAEDYLTSRDWTIDLPSPADT